ncbi:MAG TPA: cation-transporting P-type ATPase, partial [Gammaproteobacteria bacterium]|nr:cation-transporting P-type ATPase [Gammaproteobacteria bacterium]
MRIQGLNVDQALASLNTSAEGLSQAEAERRLWEFGPNRIERIAGERILPRLLLEFSHFLALVLWFGAALAFIAAYFQPGQGMARLGIAIVGVIIINGTFSFWQEYKAERALAALRQLLPQQVQVLRAGRLESRPADGLAPGDIIQLGEGDLVPADCRVIHSPGLRVNAATVTGESLPRRHDCEPSQEESALFSRNILLAGTAVVSGQARAVVFATGMRTEFGRIAHLAQTTREYPSPLQREIARLSRLAAALACVIGAAFFVIGHALSMPFWANMLFAIGIIVANVPEGLAPTVTLALAMATQRMARRNALVRHLPAVEALGSATVICCDKTGTLTQNRMAVRRIWLAGTLLDPAGIANHPELREGFAALAVNVSCCHNLEPPAEPGGPLRGDPMEVALAAFGEGLAPALSGITRRDEIPFDTDRKRMSVICDTPAGVMLYCKGAPETVLPCCDRVWRASGVVTLDTGQQAWLLKAQERLTDAGLRVLAFAHRPLSGHAGSWIETAESGLIFSAMIGLEDPPRAEVPEAVARCCDAGIRVIMVTGDHAHTALAIAREIGLVKGATPLVIVGNRLRRMSATQLQLALDAPEILFARVAAEQKLRIVEALRQKGEIVAVTGDGVNDAPALKAADIGISMGRSGTDVAKAAADLILLDDNFATIVDAIEEGRAVFDNIRKFLTYILSSNIPEIVPYLAFVLFRIPLPLTIIQILAVDLGTDLLPALALGAEKPDVEVMRRPPRRRTEPLLTPRLIVRAYLFLGVFEAAAAMVVYFLVLGSGGWRYGDQLDSGDPLY